MKNKPPGWYRNPDDVRQHGYWDGNAWVDPHAPEPAPEASSDPPDDEVDPEGVVVP